MLETDYGLDLSDVDFDITQIDTLAQIDALVRAWRHEAMPPLRLIEKTDQDEAAKLLTKGFRMRARPSGDTRLSGRLRCRTTASAIS